VRGKIALSLALALVMLLGTMNVANVSAYWRPRPPPPPKTKLSVNPPVSTYTTESIFQINVSVTNVADLYTFGFELDFAPFGNLLAVRRVLEGPFLGQDGNSTDFSSAISVLEGSVKVGDTRLGQVGGITGSGTLATIEFTVLEAGDCALNLVNTQLYNETGLIPHQVINGYFNGPHVVFKGYPKLTGVTGWWGTAKVGDTITLSSSVTETGAAEAVQTKVRYDLTRTDGKVISIWAPQSKTYVLKINRFSGDFTDWTLVGNAPYLDAAGDGNSVECTNYCSLVGLFGFEPITLAANEKVISVAFMGYGKSEDPASYADVYLFNSLTTFTYIGSIYPLTANYAYSWYDYGNIGTYLMDQDSINSATFAMHYWNDNLESGPLVSIDQAYLVITTQQQVIVAPGTTVDIPPATYTLTADDVGFYRDLKATVFVTEYGTWNQGQQKTIMVVVKWYWVPYLWVYAPKT
jgi:hypothetical protein